MKKRFGEIAVKKGWISSEALNRALELQTEERERGVDRKLGEILGEMGVLSAERIAQILKLQEEPKKIFLMNWIYSIFNIQR